jgi:hypothetical protein
MMPVSKVQKVCPQNVVRGFRWGLSLSRVLGFQAPRSRKSSDESPQSKFESLQSKIARKLEASVYA